MTRDYVLDLEVVLADGSVLHTGSKTMKCVSGYDLTRLFVGSEGTLGVVTEISLKIDPLPKASVTCTATFDSLPQAGEAVGAIMRSGIIPSVLELMDSPSLQAVNKATDLDLPEVAAMLLVETDGYTQNDDWLYRKGKIKASGRDIKIRAGVDMLHRMHKAPGGLIRADYAVVDGCFENVHFSGDYFCFPGNAIEDLEARLNGQPVSETGNILQAFYDQGGLEIPGVMSEDWLMVLAAE